MFNRFTPAGLIVVALLGCNILAMKVNNDDFKIAVHNNYGAPIDVIYTLNGNKITKKLGDKGFFTLGTNNRIEGDIIISRSGDLKSYLAKSWAQQKNALWQIWEQKKREDTDAILLTVTSAVAGTQIMVKIGVGKEETFGAVQKYQEDVLDQFPVLVQYGLQKTLTPEKIAAIRSWKDIVIPSGWYGLQGATTGEDIARYILGLPKNYDQASMDRAYRELALKWAPDKQNSAVMKEFAEKVMKLINHARDLLREKAHSGN